MILQPYPQMEKLVKAVQGFVEQYNSTMSFIEEQWRQAPLLMMAPQEEGLWPEIVA